MIPYVGCEHARELLEAFVDGELPMADQVAVESHLRWCRTCAARVEDMRLIGASIRARLAAAGAATTTRALAAIQSGVLTRVRAERDQSFAVRLREMFADMRLLWPALGATAAVVGCLVASLSVLQAATAENPESLAAMIERLRSAEPHPVLPPANPGSDQNPDAARRTRLDAARARRRPALESILGRRRGVRRGGGRRRARAASPTTSCCSRTARARTGAERDAAEVTRGARRA